MRDFYSNCVNDDELWLIRETKWRKPLQNMRESQFALGNGYMGTRGVLEEIARRYDNVKFVFFGYRPDFVGDAVPKEKLEFHKFINIGQYHMKLARLKIDIGLAPLSDNTFNKSKSNLKVLEYGVLGIPTIASPVYPYSNTIKHEKDGLLVKNDYKKWLKSLSRLIEDKEFRVSLGSKMKEKVLNCYNALDNVPLWEKVYFPEGD